MGLVHQKQIFSLISLREIPLQPYVGIEHVIIITNDPVRPIGNIKAEFKGTDPVPLRVLQDLFPGNLLFVPKHFKNSPVYPVKMSLGIGTRVRIALRLFQKAKLLLCRDRHRSKRKSQGAQDTERFLRHGPGYRFRRQIEDLIAFFLPHRLHRRENSGKRLPDPRRGLDKQPLFPGNSAVN